MKIDDSVVNTESQKDARGVYIKSSFFVSKRAPKNGNLRKLARGTSNSPREGDHGIPEDDALTA
jgi:hypothetical protein